MRRLRARVRDLARGLGVRLLRFADSDEMQRRSRPIDESTLYGAGYAAGVSARWYV